jgi:hypothetical protein
MADAGQAQLHEPDGVPANFVSGILMETGYLAAKLMYVLVAYEAGRRIAGFGPDEILVFVGTYVALTGFYAGVFAANLFQLSSLVRDGSFDTILVKPVNDQFLATFRRSDMALSSRLRRRPRHGRDRARSPSRGDAAPGLGATGLALQVASPRRSAWAPDGRRMGLV